VNPARPVLVLTLHHGALGIARSLGRLGVPVYAAGDDPSIAAARSRYFREVVRWSTRDAGEAVEQLLRIGERLERPLLLPTSDAATVLVEDHAERLLDVFEFRPRRAGLARALASKREMYALCLEHGVPTPRTEFPGSVDEARALLDEMMLPVVLKPVDGSIVPPSAGPKTVVAARADEAVAVVARLSGNVLMQEYIPGGSESVWMFNGYFGADGGCLFGVTGRKLRQHPAHGGVTSLGQCVRNETVHESTQRFMSAVGYTGILDCGYRYDRRDGLYKLLDVNPRIGSTFRLFVDTNGLDVARVWYSDLTGQPIDAGESVEGRRWLVEDIDLVSSLRYMREGALGPLAWLRSLRRIDERAWLARDDLMPLLRLPGFRVRSRLSRLARSGG
jgi:predicted ATP-grasp superfamily ATP-dependent carboligase